MLEYIKKIIVNNWTRCFNRSYRIISRSIYFDPDFYRLTYPDVNASGADPLLHYATRGYQELRQPGPFFNSLYYVKQAPELKDNLQDPLIHYLDGGWLKGLKPHPLFDPQWYMKENPELDFSGMDPFTHFLESGCGNPSSTYFNVSYYQRRYGDTAEGMANPLKHYLLYGVQDKRQPGIYFDTEWYLDRTPILRTNEIDALTHYFNYGIAEGKSPSPLFDPAYYSQTCSVEKGEDLFLHYLQHSRDDDRRPCSWFDPSFYRKQYMGEDWLQDPLEHFLSTGLRVGLYPCEEVWKLPEKPVVSILVPVYNVSSVYLNNCIRSIIHQSYPHWEICLADDCSTDDEVRILLEQWVRKDSRIKAVYLDKNLGISGATNAAATLATGQFFGFLDNDDELDNECLFRMVEKINREKADLLYSDEDLIGDDGSRFNIFHKPDFNRELLLSHNYVTHFVVTDRRLFEKVGGFDEELDGAQDYDLFLKMSEQAEKIVHVPEVLYHWRASETSTSINHDEKSYADAAGRKAVSNALVRRGIDGEVSYTDWKFFYQAQRRIAGTPLVSVIARYPKGDGCNEYVAELVSSTDYKHCEYMIVADLQSQCTEVLSKSSGWQVSIIGPGDTVAAGFNQAVQQCSGEFVVFLNGMLLPEKGDWLESLLQYAQEKGSGMVTGRVLPFNDDDPVTTVPDLQNGSEHYYAMFLQRCSQHMNGLQCTQNIFAVSWDMTMVRRSSFLVFNGFVEEGDSDLFADIDLGFRMAEKGYEHVYTPYAAARCLRLAENQGCFDETEPGEGKKAVFQRKWHSLLMQGDPYYNRGVLDQEGVDNSDFLKWYAGDAVQ